MLSTRDMGGAQHTARCQTHLRAGDSKLLESLIHPKEAALGKDMEEAQGITVSTVQEHWSGRVGLVLSQHPWTRGAVPALLLIQTQIQTKT